MKYIKAAGPYCTTHGVKVPFFMLEFSISNIISDRFYVDINQGESVGLALSKRGNLVPWSAPVVRVHPRTADHR